MFSTKKNELLNFQPSLDDLLKTGYLHGFVSAIRPETFLLRLNEDFVLSISIINNEANRVLDWRLKAYKRWLSLKAVNWFNINHQEIIFPCISYNSVPKNLKVWEHQSSVVRRLHQTGDFV